MWFLYRNVLLTKDNLVGENEMGVENVVICG
jgi:hypothetical protein